MKLYFHEVIALIYLNPHLDLAHNMKCVWHSCSHPNESKLTVISKLKCCKAINAYSLLRLLAKFNQIMYVKNKGAHLKEDLFSEPET